MLDLRKFREVDIVKKRKNSPSKNRKNRPHSFCKRVLSLRNDKAVVQKHRKYIKVDPRLPECELHPGDRPYWQAFAWLFWLGALCWDSTYIPIYLSSCRHLTLWCPKKYLWIQSWISRCPFHCSYSYWVSSRPVFFLAPLPTSCINRNNYKLYCRLVNRKCSSSGFNSSWVIVHLTQLHQRNNLF